MTDHLETFLESELRHFFGFQPATIGQLLESMPRHRLYEALERLCRDGTVKRGPKLGNDNTYFVEPPKYRRL